MKGSIVVILCLFFFDTLGQETLEGAVDKIVHDAIDQEAFPGCVVYAVKGDEVLLQKAYGHFTYDSVQTTDVNTIYDLASLTKVTAATLALMKLHDQGLLDLDKRLAAYLPDLGGSISRLSIRELLAHNSGLPPGVNYFGRMKDDEGGFLPKTLGAEMTHDYSLKLNDTLYAHNEVYSFMRAQIADTHVSRRKRYKYSGIFFFLVPELVKTISGQSFEDYLNTHFYQPLGAGTLVFNPTNVFDVARIAPTELDTVFRRKLVHGAVHDEGAVLMRGVSGNAGLFGNARDLSKVWQMLLADGTYQDKRYLSAQTINLFTSVQYPGVKNHRGLGFDKIKFTYDMERSHMAPSASVRSYGHTGFTGTIVWADPDNDLLFIFLSNRVYPHRTHTNLKELRVRPRIHELLYQELEKDRG